MVNIPVTGAVKVEYTITGGGAYALFADTATPTKWEIGLKTVDGVTDTLQRVCVTYTDGVPFASVPAEATTSKQHQATHYLRKLDSGTENWWPTDTAFGFAGETKTVCVVTDGVVQGEEVAGPFPKTPALANAAPVATVSGSTFCGLGSCYGIYTYTDAEGDAEGTSLYQWYVADDASGTNATAISGATGRDFIGRADPLKYYQFRVTPVAVSGTSPGSTAVSAWMSGM
ncbi:S-layer domain protein [Candidatus Moduliflexus flocculans]|uniref:S-layer domain protein n=1 Tax=Candidatus Moduliflexus flocculans TaxID=1499966 RepID=A0A081BQQ4_9BACT|nr:S-layer domain protein [Candidatus Moduliflexus flocculans]